MASGNPQNNRPQNDQPPGAGQKPFRRKLFYLAGFDPRGGRYYHQLLAEEIARANAQGARLALSGRRRVGENLGWTVTGDAGDGREVHSEHICLLWDDIVRANWPKGPLAVLWRTARAYQGFVGRFDWALVRRTPRGSRFTLFYPGVTLFALPLLLFMLIWGLAGLVLPGRVALAGALVAGVLASVVILRRIHSLWLLRFIIFNDTLARTPPQGALAERLAAFAGTITAALASDDADEVLFVTHSNGSVLAMPIMAELLRRNGEHLPARFHLVTLGNCVPLVACRRDAGWFHAALDQLAGGSFAWLDIGSLTDGACVPLVPPCLGRAVESPPGLVQLSPRWFRYADPATYHKRRADKYAAHFDYLRRLARPSPLDYIGITCAPRPLARSIGDFIAENAHD